MIQCGRMDSRFVVPGMLRRIGRACIAYLVLRDLCCRMYHAHGDHVIMMIIDDQHLRSRSEGKANARGG